MYGTEQKNNPDPAQLSHQLHSVQQRIAQATVGAGRHVASVKLLAVSKTFSAATVQAAYAVGQKAFGENYVQEARAKMAALDALRAELEWHFIGAIQNNKTAFIAQHFDWVHTVDRLSTAERLSAQRPDHLPALNICLQVNISREPQKNGVAPEKLEALAQAVVALPRLCLRGLMALPKAPTIQSVPSLMSSLEAHQNNDEKTQRFSYREMYSLYGILRAQGLALDTLSLGTSSDMEAAISEGATMVRVGHAIFGDRAQ